MFLYSPLNVCIPAMIIICLYRNYLTRVMNQFDLEFKKLLPVIYDIQSSIGFCNVIYICMFSVMFLYTEKYFIFYVLGMRSFFISLHKNISNAWDHHSKFETSV